MESSIDQGPFLNVVEHGLITAVASEPTTVAEEVQNEHAVSRNQAAASAITTTGSEPTIISEVLQDEHAVSSNQDEYTSPDIEMDVQLTEKPNSPDTVIEPLKSDASGPAIKYLNQLSRHSRKSFWLLAYIALVTSLPLVGSALQFLFRKKLRNVQKR